MSPEFMANYSTEKKDEQVCYRMGRRPRTDY